MRFDEVMALAQTGPLLRPSGSIVDRHSIVVSDFAEAQEYAYRRYLTDADDAFNWLDLRSIQRLDGAGLADAEWDELTARRMVLTEQLYEIVPPRLPQRYASVVNDVVGDLGNCAYFRAAFGAGDRLFDRIWNAYLQGGWPCGWVGEYPAGELVVFTPTPE